MKIKALKSFTTADLTLSLANGWIRDVDDTLGAQLIADGFAEEYEVVHPEGQISITENGTVNVAQYETAAVNVGVYTVTYNLNGGTGTILPDAVAAGNTVTLNNGSTITPPTNKSFLGWATTAGATEPNLESQYKPTGDITIYAVYEVVAYTVTYNVNGGSGSVDPATVSVGDSVNLSDGTGVIAPAHKGFVGWATTSDAQIPDVTSPYTPTGDITLYAVYEVTEYVVTYDANGGTGTIAPEEVAVGQSITLNDGTDLTPPNPGDWLESWGTDPLGGGVIVGGPGESYTPTGDVTLYAQWGS